MAASEPEAASGRWLLFCCTLGNGQPRATAYFKEVFHYSAELHTVNNLCYNFVCYSAIVFEQARYTVSEDSVFSLLCLSISDLRMEKTIQLSTVSASARGTCCIASI